MSEAGGGTFAYHLLWLGPYGPRCVPLRTSSSCVATSSPHIFKPLSWVRTTYAKGEISAELKKARSDSDSEPRVPDVLADVGKLQLLVI